MISDTDVDPSVLSPRAAVALLTLQLRSTLQEAVESEAEVSSLDVDGAIWQLRSRLAPLLEDRRRALAAELSAEQERAEARIAAARAEANEVVAAATMRADALRAERTAQAEAERLEHEARMEAERLEHQARMEAARSAAAALAARESAAGAIDPTPPVSPPAPGAADSTPPGLDPSVTDHLDDGGTSEVFDDPLLDWQPEPEPPTEMPTELPPPAPVTYRAIPVRRTPVVEQAPIVEVEPNDDVVAADAVWSETPPPPESTTRLPSAGEDHVVSADPERPAAMHVVIDAESFARAFAAAIAPVLDARETSHRSAPLSQGYVPAPPPQKRTSFWSHAWHPDVLLSGLAMVIVIIVLIAWTG